MGAADYVVLALIAAALAAAIGYIVRQHRRGRCVGCGGECAACGRACARQKGEKTDDHRGDSGKLS